MKELKLCPDCVLGTKQKQFFSVESSLVHSDKQNQGAIKCQRNSQVGLLL